MSRMYYHIKTIKGGSDAEANRELDRIIDCGGEVISVTDGPDGSYVIRYRELNPAEPKPTAEMIDVWEKERIERYLEKHPNVGPAFFEMKLKKVFLSANPLPVSYGMTIRQFLAIPRLRVSSMTGIGEKRLFLLDDELFKNDLCIGYLNYEQEGMR